MKTSREILEEQLADAEEELRGLKAYIQELKATTAKYGTDKAQFEDDLMEAEHNLKFYNDEIAGLKSQLGALPGPGRPVTGRPHLPKSSLSPFMLSSISFVAGALLGSRLGCRGKDEE